MATISYNGVNLPYPYVTSFRQEAIRDESNTDWYLVKFDIAAEFVVNGNYLSELVPDLFEEGAANNGNAAQIMDVIRSRLMEPRRPLAVKFANVDLVPQQPVGIDGFVDAKNGPLPQNVSITTLENETFLCSFHVIAHYWENNVVSLEAGTNAPLAVNTKGNTVLYNRWSESVSIDNLNYTSRTRTGKFVIRSDNKDGFIADQIRVQMVSVKIPEGFLRESATYTVDPSGLGISYTIVDKQVFKKPPDPAFEARGDYYESASREWAKRHGEVNVTLKGDKGTNQAELCEKAVEIAGSKVALRGAMILGGRQFLGTRRYRPILESAGLRMNMYENEVTVTMRVMYKQPKERLARCVAGWPGITTETPFSDGHEDYVPEYLMRGTAGLLIQAAAYYDPSVGKVAMYTNPIRPNDNVLVPTGDAVVGVAGQGLAVGTAGLTEEPSHVQ